MSISDTTSVVTIRERKVYYNPKEFEVLGNVGLGALFHPCSQFLRQEPQDRMTAAKPGRSAVGPIGCSGQRVVAEEQQFFVKVDFNGAGANVPVRCAAAGFFAERNKNAFHALHLPKEAYRAHVQALPKPQHWSISRNM